MNGPTSCNADAHDKFPHETTADQFFDENQFEAYRHLGYKATALTIETLLSSLLVKAYNKQRIDNAATIDEIIAAILCSEQSTEATDSASWCPNEG